MADYLDDGSNNGSRFRPLMQPDMGHHHVLARRPSGRGCQATVSHLHSRLQPRRYGIR